MGKPITTNSNTGVAVAAVRKAETTRLSSLISCHGSVTSATRELEKTCRYACTKRIQNFCQRNYARAPLSGLTTNGQTLQKACNIDYCGTSSEVDDVNRRTDPCKDFNNVEQTQKPAPAVTNQVRGNTSPRHVPTPWPA